MRRFVFEAGRWNGAERAIACDGLVPGATLDLSHWQGNRTPADFKADTSTEIALRFVTSSRARDFEDTVVVNNHFDTDGVLSIWTLLSPEAAVARRDLLVAAAEAGDFEAWPRDARGIRLDAALRAHCERGDGDAAAYARAFAALPDLLDTSESRPDLWGDAWTRIEEACAAIDEGRIVLGCHEVLAIVHHTSGTLEIPGPLLARELGDGFKRCLLVFERPGGLEYRYQRPRYAWADTVVRPTLPAPDAAPLADALGPEWTFEDLEGLSDIARTRHPVQHLPDTVIDLLRETDPALAAMPWS